MIVSLIIGVFGGYGPPLYNVKEWHLEWFWRLCPGVSATLLFYDSLTTPLWDTDEFNESC